jgi:hypothetical protein
MTQWKKVEVPTGNYIGWGKVGQQVTLAVVAYDVTGGEDFNGNPCPQVVGTLTEDAMSYRDKGATEDPQKAGAMVTVKGGQANLKRALQAASPEKGDLLRITYTEDVKVAKGTAKDFEVEIAPGAAAEAEDDL